MTEKVRKELTGLLKVNSQFREANIDRFDIMDKVKKVKLLPGINEMTIQMAAEYLEVSVGTIGKCVRLLQSEFAKDEFTEHSYEEVKNVIAKSGVNISDYGGGFSFDFDGIPFLYSFSRNSFISKKGLFRISMIISRSEIGKKIREAIVHQINGWDKDTTNKVNNSIIEKEEQMMYQASEHRKIVLRSLKDKAFEIVSSFSSLNFIPGFEYATIGMIANHFNESSDYILNIYKKYPCEFAKYCISCRPIANTIFDASAIMCFAMMLKNNEIAHRMRIEMVNYLYDSNYKKVQKERVHSKHENTQLPKVEIDSVEAEIGKVFLNGTVDELEGFLNRICSGIDKEITEKEKENELLSKQNKYLAKILENVKSLQAITA